MWKKSGAFSRGKKWVNNIITSSLCCITGLSLLLSGCNREQTNVSHEAAAQLYTESIKLLAAYIDSLKNAGDSAQVESLDRTFDSKINAVNFAFPPDTDLRLTEEENDSLIKMAVRMVRIRKERLHYFAYGNNDTIPNDSIIEASPYDKTSISQSAQLK